MQSHPVSSTKTSAQNSEGNRLIYSCVCVRVYGQSKSVQFLCAHEHLCVRFISVANDHSLPVPRTTMPMLRIKVPAPAQPRTDGQVML